MAISSRWTTDYPRRDTATQLDRFRTARLQTVEMAEDGTVRRLAAPRPLWRLWGMTLDGLVRLLVSHDHQHLAGMQWLLMRPERRSGPRTPLE